MSSGNNDLKKIIVSPKVGLSICVVTGLAAGFFAGEKWFLPGAGVALLISIANILWKSKLYQNYLENIRKKNKEGKRGVVFFLVLSFILNIVIIAAVAYVVRILKGAF